MFTFANDYSRVVVICPFVLMSQEMSKKHKIWTQIKFKLNMNINGHVGPKIILAHEYNRSSIFFNTIFHNSLGLIEQSLRTVLR